MENEKAVKIAEEIMTEFAAITGLEPVDDHPARYLWTDAFAVCNYLELFSHTGDRKYLNLALRLVDQVHHVLGKHREDDERSGLISGLKDQEAENHPTSGGLRIGKKLKERKINEPADQRLEWEQDGQYYHYLTKWMHALNRAGKVTNNPDYIRWAVELAQAAHKSFIYIPANKKRKMMHWKMSIDLSYPLVPSMGQHDPLDGFITYNELQLSTREFKQVDIPELDNEISEMADICRGMNLATDDPLGIGGLLFDATRVAQFILGDDEKFNNLFELILNSSYISLDSFIRSNPLMVPPDYRLAFRELGLSIGFKGVKMIHEWFEESGKFKENSSAYKMIKFLLNHSSLGDSIEEFWIQNKNWHLGSWAEHREINMVMLATSLIPDGFLLI